MCNIYMYIHYSSQVARSITSSKISYTSIRRAQAEYGTLCSGFVTGQSTKTTIRREQTLAVEHGVRKKLQKQRGCVRQERALCQSVHISQRREAHLRHGHPSTETDITLQREYMKFKKPQVLKPLLHAGQKCAQLLRTKTKRHLQVTKCIIPVCRDSLLLLYQNCLY